MNGFKTTILEKSHKVGGQCTSWQKGDFTINGCIHWLSGSGPGNYMYEIWRELGAVQEVQMVNHDRFVHLENIQGQDVILYCDPEKLKNHLLAIAPEEEELIKNFIRGIQLIIDFDLPLFLGGLGENEKVPNKLRQHLKKYPMLGKYCNGVATLVKILLKAVKIQD